MGRKHNNANSKPPSHVLTLYDYDPVLDVVHNQEEPDFVAPDKSIQLPFKRGERLAVISTNLEWWLVCKSTESGKEGYVPTVFVAPLCDANKQK